jgi:CelD/BcsL family acetyltransferase involved in cellulose biosynthesis
VNLETQSDPGAFAALRPEWNALLESSPTNTVFLTWEWQSAWWEAYHPGELFIVTVRDESGTLVGIAPWFIDTTNPDERVLRGIGCVDVTDYVDVIAHADHFSEVLSAFATAAAQAPADRINLCNLREHSPALAGLQAAFEQAGLVTETVQQEVCPVITLSGRFEEYFENLDKKQRHELRRKFRLGVGTEGLAWHVVGAEDDLNAALDDFTALMAESTAEKAEFLQNPQHAAFFRAVMPLMQQLGVLQLAFLTYNRKPVAAYLNFVYRNRIMVYNSGLSLTSGSLSPGIVLLLYLIQDAVSKGITKFDFLRGDEEYKYRMGGVDEPIFMLKAHKAT